MAKTNMVSCMPRSLRPEAAAVRQHEQRQRALAVQARVKETLQCRAALRRGAQLTVFAQARARYPGDARADGPVRCIVVGIDTGRYGYPVITTACGSKAVDSSIAGYGEATCQDCDTTLNEEVAWREAAVCLRVAMARILGPLLAAHDALLAASKRTADIDRMRGHSSYAGVRMRSTMLTSGEAAEDDEIPAGVEPLLTRVATLLRQVQAAPRLSEGARLWDKHGVYRLVADAADTTMTMRSGIPLYEALVVHNDAVVQAARERP